VTQREAILDIIVERYRQQELRDKRRIPFTCDNASIAPEKKLAVLVEEVGEVASALQPDGGNLREELVQVAAVALAWLEALEGT
jgi:NTP pyrophosphatase (non-canonical NTP hydrolase)